MKIDITEDEANALLLAISEALGGWEDNDGFEKETAAVNSVERKIRAAKPDPAKRQGRGKPCGPLIHRWTYSRQPVDDDPCNCGKRTWATRAGDVRL